MTNRVCVYVRTSAEDHSPDSALSEQIQACARWCNRNQAPAILMFVDAPVSGGSGERPSLKQMLVMAAEPNPSFNLILAYSPSRLFRDSAALESCMADLAQVGVRVEFVIKPLDSSNLGEVAMSMPKLPTGEMQ